jgi:hypothetical protein
MLDHVINVVTFRKGYRTFFFGLVTAVGPTIYTYLSGYDWTKIGISPAAGAFIGVIIMGLRSITTTPPGKA